MKPQLRFKEFTDEWEEKKLGEIADVRDGTHSSPKFVKEGYPLITSKNLKDGKLDYSAINYISKYDYEEINKRSYVENNDILMAMIGTIGNPVKIVKEKEFAIKNVALIKDKNRQNNYLIHYLQSNNIKKQFLLELAGGTQKFISLSTIRNIKIQLPSLLEQEKIGKFFSLLDQRIEKQEQKVTLLEEEKKGYMQRLFKQELRFKNEQGNDYPAWEEKKLGKIADIKAGKDLDKSKLINVGYPVYGNALTNKGLMGYYDTYEIKDEAVTVTGRGDIGKAFYRKGKFNTVGRLISIVSKENPYFLSYAINKIKILNETTGVPQLTALQLKKYKVQLPSLSEQKKIANFLGLLDQRIEKEQEKLELMKDEKKGFMQRMFV